MMTVPVRSYFDGTAPGSNTNESALPSPPSAADNSAAGAENISAVSLVTNTEVWLSSAVLLFGVVVMTLVLRSLNLNRAHHVESILLLFTVISIIFGTLWVIAAGFDQAQISSALALFGTIAGYLLGNRHARTHEEDQEDRQ